MRRLGIRYSGRYAAGSILMARPYISSPAALFIAGPAAAVAGMLALGVLALLIAAVFVMLANADFPDVDLGSRRRRSGGGGDRT